MSFITLSDRNHFLLDVYSTLLGRDLKRNSLSFRVLYHLCKLLFSLTLECCFSFPKIVDTFDRLLTICLILRGSGLFFQKLNKHNKMRGVYYYLITECMQ